jgi:hypothetical protein
MKEKLKLLLKQKRIRSLLLAFVVALLLAILTSFRHTEEAHTSQSFSADTVIPKGYVLVPIEIQNIESLHSLVGAFAVVDLFTTARGSLQKGGIRVGRKLRLIRAPLNPQLFAVLVPENEASEVLAAQGPVTAVIQNPNNDEPGEVIKHKVKYSGIEYFKGGSHD